MIPSYMSLVPINHWSAAVNFSILKCEGKKFKSTDYYARYFFSYLRNCGMTDNAIYRFLGRIGERRKGNSLYAGMNSKNEYRRAIHIAIKSEGKTFIHPLSKAVMLPLMYPTLSHRKDCQRDNQIVMISQRDKKIRHKCSNNTELERKQFLYMCCIELYYKQYERSDYDSVFEWLNDMSDRLELFYHEQEKILVIWYERVFSRCAFFPEFDSDLANLYGHDSYQCKRLIELKEQIEYEANFVEDTCDDNKMYFDNEH